MEWPIQEHVRDALEQAALTHYVSPLPVFDEDSSIIEPHDYQKKLCGVIVQVHFALAHYFIKQEKKISFLCNRTRNRCHTSSCRSPNQSP